jgi:hypothetical protein
MDLDEYWRRCVETKDWESALLELAEAITVKWPDKSSGWVKQAYALHELGRTGEAFQVLFGVIELFPNEYLPPTTWLVTACKAAKLDQARRWLRKSIEIWAT